MLPKVGELSRASKISRRTCVMPTARSSLGLGSVSGWFSRPLLKGLPPMNNSCHIGLVKAMAKLPRRDRKVGKVRCRSENTKRLLLDRVKTMKMFPKGSQEWHCWRNKYRNKIPNSCRQDFRDWVDRVVDEIELAEDRADAKEVSRLGFRN